MSNENKKRIAHIFEEEQVFLTKSGCFYGYENIDGTFKCHRLNTLEIHRFLYRMKGVKKDIVFLSSGGGSKKPLPRKFEETALKEM
ncbi:MAG: hypothetical protein IJ545_01625 [Alphaproteobacteria bacterium]|nr:hypothetical protein [Alphaproteobacteria bacterium]